MKRFVFAAFFLCFAVSLSACGGGGGGEAAGGGGGGGNTIDDLALTFETNEYNSQAGLRLINASHAYAQGSLAALATAGSGQTIAIIDTGIDLDHEDLVGNIAPGGFDFVTDSVTITDPNGHGSHVGGIAAARRNGALMHGVAFNAKILPIRIFDENGLLPLTDARVADAVDFARARGATVHNNSWGIAIPITDFTQASAAAFLPSSLDAYRRNAAAGVVTVFAAGNDFGSQVTLRPGLPLLFPELANHWVAVSSVDLSGNEPTYTNRCGVAAAWCIAAPGGGSAAGTGILSTRTGGGTIRMSGTSMAAPHVAGAVAVLQDLFPGSTSAEIVQRMFVTADKSGVFSNAARFGNGLLDLKAASEPVDTVGIRSGGHVTGDSFDIGQTMLAAGGAVGNGLRAGLDGVTLAVFDSLNAAFQIDVSALIGESAPVTSLTDLRRGFGGDTALTHTNLGQFGQLGLAYRQTDSGPFVTDMTLARARYAISFGDGSLLTASYNEAPTGHFGLEADGRVSAAETGAPDAFTAPYLGLVDDDHYTAAGTIPIGIGGALLRIGGFRGETAENGNADRSDGFGALAELVIPVADGGHLGLTIGRTVEDDRFLGTAGEGAFDLGSDSETLFGGVSLAAPLGGHVELVGSAYVGRTVAEAGDSSLFTGFSPIISNSFSIGLIGHSLAEDRSDRFGILLNQPLRVMRGEARLGLASDRQKDGSLIIQTVSADLEPTGRELDLEVFYGRRIGSGRVNASLMLRYEPDHVAGADPQGVALVGFHQRF